MITEQQQEQASLYALGAMTGPEEAAFEAGLRGNAELRELVRELAKTAGCLALAGPITAPPAGLKDRVMSRATRANQPAPPQPARPGAELAGLFFVAGAERGGWKELPIQGARIKLLSLEKERGYAVLLGQLDPGARYPAHVNAGPEDFYILSGDLVVGERKLGAGDFHHARGGSWHEENYSVEGCTLLAVLTTDDPLVAFAMA
jgi:anti-sigma factor ChrR (cupin superfamily)